MESSKAIQGRLETTKKVLEQKKVELDDLKRMRGEEAAKAEPNLHRLSDYDNKISQVQVHLENLPHTIRGIEARLEEAQRMEASRRQALNGVESSIPVMQKKTQELLALLKKADEVNTALLRLNEEIVSREREARIRVHRPYTSIGFQTLRTLLTCIEAESKGERRPMLFFPMGRRQPL